MAITSSENPKFKSYSDHIFKWEGLMDDDPKDRASSCVNNLTNVAKRGKFGLPIHTVRGVTYCNFLSLAARLGITPVTHQRFVNMTKDDVRKFIFYTYSQFPWKDTADEVAISLTETAWGSGPGRVWPTVIDTLKKMNIPTMNKKSGLSYTSAEQKRLIADINRANSARFFDVYWKTRYDWLDKLGQTPYGSRFRRGWLNRQNDFKRLKTSIVTQGLPFFFLVLLGSGIYYFSKKKF